MPKGQRGCLVSVPTDIFVPVPPTVEVATDSSSGRVTVSGKAAARQRSRSISGGTSRPSPPTPTAAIARPRMATCLGRLVVTQTGMPGAAGKPVRRPYVDTVAPTPMKVTIDSMRTDGNSGVVTVTGYTVGGSTVTVTFPTARPPVPPPMTEANTVTSTADIPAGPIRVSARGPRNSRGSADGPLPRCVDQADAAGRQDSPSPAGREAVAEPGSMTYTEIAKSFDGSSLGRHRGTVPSRQTERRRRTAALLAAIKLHDPNYRLESDKMFIY